MSSIKNNNCSRKSISERLVPLLTKELRKSLKKDKGWADQKIRRWLDGNLPSSENLIELCDYLNISVTWLLTGSDRDCNNELPILIRVQSNDDKMLLDNSADDYRGIPLYESGLLSAGANGVAFDQNEEPTSIVVVYRPELKNCSTHRLAALKVGGDSMEPTITEGSIVVVDVDDKEFYDGRVYVINSCESGLDIASIKRIKRWDKGEGFIILSDNHKYHPDITTLDWPNLCVGRVVWMWRDIRNV